MNGNKNIDELEKKLAGELDEVLKEVIKKRKEEFSKRISNEGIAKISERAKKFYETIDNVLSSKQGNGKILLVEDNSYYIQKIVRNLNGKNVVVATNLEDAKKEFDKGDVSLVITDISYPMRKGEGETPSSGLSFIRYVKEKRPDMFVIAQSASSEYLISALFEGANVTFNKDNII